MFQRKFVCVPVATGQPCLNLDPWAMRATTIRAAVSRLSEGADTVICEGVMGLFDGATVQIREAFGIRTSPYGFNIPIVLLRASQ